MVPFLRYTLLRFTLLVAVGAALYALGLRDLLLVALTLVVSAVLSYLLLAGPRQVLVERMEERAAARASRARSGDADAATEDAALEQRRDAAPQRRDAPPAP